MFWEVFLYAVFVIGYIVSLIVFLLKRPDKQLNKTWHRIAIRISYPIAAIIIVWFTVNLITLLKN